jgi:hypothetical protein
VLLSSSGCPVVVARPIEFDDEDDDENDED